MPTLTNTGTEAVDCPLFGIGSIEPGASVEIDDAMVTAFENHPNLTVSGKKTKKQEG